jgi:hypothetical protein
MVSIDFKRNKLRIQIVQSGIYQIMRAQTIFGSTILGVLLITGAAMATPVTTLTPLNSNGTDVYAVYVSGNGGDRLELSEMAPNSISNIFCNHGIDGCTPSTIGQTVNLGNTGPGIVFGLTNATHLWTYTTDARASDGYAHDLVSATVDASNAGAVATAFGTVGQGALNPAAAASIALLGETPGTIVTFVAWEDTLYGDYNYNDMIFAFTDPIPRAVPEPITLAMFGFGLAALVGFRMRSRRQPSKN